MGLYYLYYIMKVIVTSVQVSVRALCSILFCVPAHHAAIFYRFSHSIGTISLAASSETTTLLTLYIVKLLDIT